LKRKVGTWCGQKEVTTNFKHPVQKGLVTIPHPKKDVPKGTVKSILRQAGIE